MSEVIINDKGKYYVILHNKNGQEYKYIVPLYSIKHNVIVRFYDKKFDRFKNLPFSQCEITEQKSTISEQEEVKLKDFYLYQYNLNKEGSDNDI